MNGVSEKRKNVELNTELSTSDTASSDKSFVQTNSENGSKLADTHSDNQRSSKSKETANSINSKEFVENNNIPSIGENEKTEGAEQNTNIRQQVTEEIGGVKINYLIPPSGDEVDIETLKGLQSENNRLLSESVKEFAKNNNVTYYEANQFVRVAVNPDKRLGSRKTLKINKAKCFRIRKDIKRRI